MKQDTNDQNNHQVPWNKGKLIGQKLPLKLKEIWAIRIRLQTAIKTRELALFNLAIDSKLRGCDLFNLALTQTEYAAVVKRSHLQSGRLHLKNQPMIKGSLWPT